jgi:glutaredoxin 3
MAKVEIYTTTVCPYCVRAKDLLTRKGASYVEHNLTGRDAEREALVARTNMRTVPQIFINDRLIGGCDDLYALDKKGELDGLLAQPG